MNYTLSDVLRIVNVVRKALGKRGLTKLPEGVFCHPTDCPIAKATGLRTGSWSFILTKKTESKKVARALDSTVVESYITTYKYNVHFPEVIYQFIHDFDNEKYPELIKGRKK